MKETDLAKKIIEYFSDQDLYFEVPPTNADIVVKNDNILTAIETKLVLNFKVIEQAYRNKSYYNYSYIAVPAAKDRSFAMKICQDYGIGLLVVTKYNDKFIEVSERVKPQFNRKALSKYIELNEYMKRSIAGSSGSDGNVMTAFKITVENMERYLQRHGGCTWKELFKSIDTHYANFSSFKSSIYKWINKGVIKNIEIRKGKLYYNDPFLKSSTAIEVSILKKQLKAQQKNLIK